ncbi:ATP-binding protein [Paenibacillus sp. NEAU-GSW1]|uniref:ATP-binding protein n=1 Tax=Paenibacillus sp. NEAU-GSW1 TaxID=2682486 RepID=UPI0012E1581B|nr:ATP-binding protein [Paenibacillus sp. NEAU-GSW1]MUT67119.1 ATP-binding protein [Paenibacillus sp. NEAU-GSW1]
MHYPIFREIQLFNRMDELERLNELLESVGSEAGWHPRAVLDLSLACEELIVNIVNYGFPSGGEHTIAVCVKAASEAVEVNMDDGGIPFNPLEEESPDTTLALEDREIGGLGLFFVRRLMDEVHYERTGGRNHLRLRKGLTYAGKQDDSQRQAGGQ